MKAEDVIRYRTVSTDAGEFLLGAGNRGLCLLKPLNGKAPRAKIREWVGDGKREAIDDPQSCAPAARQLQEYLAGKRTSFDLKLDLQGTPFQRAVWHALLKIPYGRTASYGEIARRIGRPRAARAVGMANNRNPVAIVVPCHRVIGADGALVGYGGGLPLKQRLLELERAGA